MSKKGIIIVYCSIVVNTLILVLIENWMAHMKFFYWRVELAFAIFDYIIVTFFTLVVLCIYEDIQCYKAAHSKKENDENTDNNYREDEKI
jgi:hypothetical protein